MTTRSRKLQYADRVALQQADQAIRKDVLRALVEIITNSNDSYSRLDDKGVQVGGEIIIDVLRKHKNSVIRVRDFAEVDHDGRITEAIANDALNRMEVDTYGLDEMDRKFLLAIIEKFDGGPVGLGTIAAALHEEKDSIEEIIEPYLMQIGFLNRTPRGRMATRHAFEHLGLNPRNSVSPPSLFE